MVYSMTLKEAAHTYQLYLIVGISAARTAMAYSVMGYLVVYAVSAGISTAQAALALSLFSVASLIGRLSNGVLGNVGVPNRLLVLLSAAASGVAGILLFLGGSFPVFVLAALCAGYSFGSGLVCGTMYYSLGFGPENFSVILGTVTPVATVAGAVGPLAVGLMYTATGGYGGPFLILGIINLVAAVGCLFLSIPKLRYGKPQETAA